MGTGASIPVNLTTSPLTDDPTQTTSLIATLLDGFINLPSSLNKELASAIGANPAAMQRLKELGYEFKEVEEHVEAQLPPILANFSILKESDGIAKILNDPSFQAAQDAVAKTPNDEAAVETLRQKAEELKKVTISIVESRIAEENIVATCQNVVIAGKCFFF